MLQGEERFPLNQLLRQGAGELFLNGDVCVMAVSPINRVPLGKGRGKWGKIIELRK